MKFIILSIKPKYANAILSGKKKCEFRKEPFTKYADYVVIYSTAPIAKIVGWFKIKKQYSDSPAKLWAKYSKVGGITKAEFDKYFKDKEKGIVLEIEEVNEIRPPIDPFKLIDNFVAPQSYRYVNGIDYVELSPVIDILQKQMKLHEITA
jgi:predicted transcriptional regulator